MNIQLYRVFRDLCLRGDLDPDLVRAFRIILNYNNHKVLENFLSNTKSEARNALGNEVSLDFLDVDLSPDVSEKIEVEKAYSRLWEASRRTSEPSTMAAVRLSMIESFGEEKQRELIAEWEQ
jgi:hypothetical protein